MERQTAEAWGRLLEKRDAVLKELAEQIGVRDAGQVAEAPETERPSETVALEKAVGAALQTEAGRAAFDRLYEHRYAHHSPEESVEMVNIRLGAVGKRPTLKFPSVAAAGTATPEGERAAYFSSASKPLMAKVYRRDKLGAGAEIAGHDGRAAESLDAFENGGARSSRGVIYTAYRGAERSSTVTFYNAVDRYSRLFPNELRLNRARYA